MIESFIGGFAALCDPLGIAMLILGNIIGLVFGVLPGLGSVQAMALVLPFTFGMQPMHAMFFYAGIMGSVTIGGAVTAILINIPGTAGNIATSFEGYPMTRRGETVRAVSLSAFASIFGEFVGIAILILVFPITEHLILNLRAPEIFWITIFGLFSVAFVAPGNFLKGLVAACIGVLLSLVGRSPLFPMSRFALGTYYLWDGIKLIAFFVGLFAIQQILLYVTPSRGVDKIGKKGWKPIAQGIKDAFSYPVTLVRSSIIGTIVGIIPGIGASVANMLSYTTTVQFTKLRKDEPPFGTGNVQGLVASESANNAKEGGALLTTVTLGIPGSPDMAVLLGAFVLHGIQPGLQLVTTHADIVWALILGLAFTQFIAAVLVLNGSTWFARILNMRTEFVTLPVLLACLVGAYAIRENIWDAFVMIAAGFFGFGMRRFGFPIITLAIGFVLGPFVELNLTQSLGISLGDISILFTRPIAIGLMVLLVFFAAVPIWRALPRRRVREHGIKHQKPKEESRQRPSIKLVNRGAFMFELGLLLALAAFLYSSIKLGQGPGRVPLIMSTAALIFLMPIVLSEFVPQIQRYFKTGITSLSGKSQEITQGAAQSEIELKPPAKTVIGMVALIILLLPAIYFVGYMVAVPLCFLGYLVVVRKTRWRTALLFAVVSWAVLYFGFDQLLQLKLWRGAVPTLIPGWLGGEIAPRFL